MLQQFTAFRPFMGKPCAFSQVTGRASQYYIVDVMSRIMFSAAQRNSMLEMEDMISVSLLKPARAIIALITLRLQFILYLLRGKRTFNSFLLYFTSMIMSAVYNFTSFCCAIPLHSRSNKITLGLISLLHLLEHRFFVRLIITPVIGSVLLSVSLLLIPPTVFIYILFVSSEIVSLF